MEGRFMKNKNELESTLMVYHEEIINLKLEANNIAKRLASKPKKYWDSNLAELSELIDRILFIQEKRRSLDDFKDSSISEFDRE
jgi:hypothetical protein